MSGGYFDYNQYRIEDIIGKLDRLISNNERNDVNEYGTKIGRHYPADVIEKFKQTHRRLVEVSKMVHRIDWLVSGDDSIDSFNERWSNDGLSM